jgi:Putative Ig domain
VTIGDAPVFYADSPSLTATNGEQYSYAFGAKGDPAPSYALGSGSPSWLHVDSRSGTLWGTVPDWVTSFSYSVTATNSAGSATAGPYTVYIKQHRADIRTYLSCTSKVYSGGKGTCTLSVTNAGRYPAPDVTAQVNLPSQLRALSCGYYWWNRGCTISGNTASENLGPLSPGQAKTLSVVFAAQSSHSIWGWHRYHTITVKVTGFAASDEGFWGFGGRSYSTAYVTIVPRGWWWAF